MTEFGRDNNVPFVRDYVHTGPSEADYNDNDMEGWREDADRRIEEAGSGVEPQSTGSYIADHLQPAAEEVEQVPPKPQQ